MCDANESPKTYITVKEKEIHQIHVCAIYITQHQNQRIVFLWHKKKERKIHKHLTYH